MNSELEDKLMATDLNSYLEKIRREISELEKLRKRFGRDTLNIAVIGRPRQGKSLFLQSISQLDETVIPSGSRLSCTGTRSIIRHNPDQNREGAKVYFYSTQEFLELVIKPYYRKFNLGPSPQSIAQLALFQGDWFSYDHANSINAFEYEFNQLKEYVDYLDHYQNLLDRPPLSIQLKDVRKYVAQYGFEGKSQKFYHNYFAVKHVEITCDYGHDEIGQVALIDMPGLGDTKIGGQERQIKAVGEEADVVLFIKKPTTGGAIWEPADVELYKLIESTLTQVPIDRWAFMVLNKTVDPKLGDNSDNCNDLKKSIGDVGIYVVPPTMIANCSRIEEARDKVLDKILDYLASNMQDLDEYYA